MRPLTAGLAYFALVFGAGFVLGTLRTLVLLPRVGERAAELIEAPLMLGVTVLAARWVVPKLSAPKTAGRRVAVGLIALAALLAAETLFVVALRGVTLVDYLRGRDPVAGAVYLALLAAFAVMPVLVHRRL